MRMSMVRVVDWREVSYLCMRSTLMEQHVVVRGYVEQRSKPTDQVLERTLNRSTDIAMRDLHEAHTGAWER